MNILRVLKSKKAYDTISALVIIAIIAVFFYECPYRLVIKKIKILSKNGELLEKAFRYDREAKRIESVNDKIKDFYTLDRCKSKVENVINALKVRFTISDNKISLEKRTRLSYVQVINLLARLENTRMIIVKRLNMKNVLNIPVLSTQDKRYDDKDVELEKLDFELVSTDIFHPRDAEK
ncbi:MAG: hypothetical protein J7K51_00700 [Thermotogae bacterium]|nr:hypothetical protein [Thermotogota bacterium]